MTLSEPNIQQRLLANSGRLLLLHVPKNEDDVLEIGNDRRSTLDGFFVRGKASDGGVKRGHELGLLYLQGQLCDVEELYNAAA